MPYLLQIFGLFISISAAFILCENELFYLFIWIGPFALSLGVLQKCWPHCNSGDSDQVDLIVVCAQLFKIKDIVS